MQKRRSQRHRQPEAAADAEALDGGDGGLREGVDRGVEPLGVSNRLYTFVVLLLPDGVVVGLERDLVAPDELRTCRSGVPCSAMTASPASTTSMKSSISRRRRDATPAQAGRGGVLCVSGFVLC